jgi:hypothetical protein
VITPAIRGQVIDEIAVTTVLPTRRGVRQFNADSVDIRFLPRGLIRTNQ